MCTSVSRMKNKEKKKTKSKGTKRTTKWSHSLCTVSFIFVLNLCTMRAFRLCMRLGRNWYKTTFVFFTKQLIPYFPISTYHYLLEGSYSNQTVVLFSVENRRNGKNKTD